MGTTVPEIVEQAVLGTCREIGVDPGGARRRVDRRRVQRLAQRAGAAVRARRAGAGPRGQADRVRRERLRLRRAGRALRRREAADGPRRHGHRGRLREDARRRGQDGRQAHRQGRSATSPTRTSAPGKVFVFPHLFAEVMDLYMKAHGVTEERSRDDRGAGVRATPSTTRTRRCSKVRLTVDQALHDRGHQPLRRRGPAAEDLRLLADHRRLRRPDPRDRGGPRAARRRRRPTASRSPATAQATDPLKKEGRDVLRPRGRLRAR